jgi:hypothetical protein
VDDLTRDPDLFVRQKHPPSPFYPFDRKEDMADVFRNVVPDKDYHAYSNAHIVNLSLRVRESARLFFRPQGEGRYFLTPAFRPNLGNQYKDYWLVGPVRKDSFAWTDRKPASYGNGLLEYTPELRSEAFARENPDRQGIAAGQGPRVPDLVAAKRGELASLILKTTTPWVIAGLQNDLTNFDDNTDAAVVSGLFWRQDAADENRISVSRDGGQTWTTVWENRYLGAVPFRVDLTKWTEGEYGYWVRFEWVDRKGSGQVGLERLRVRTWVELSPMALPRIVEGPNRFRVDAAPERVSYNHSRWDRGQGLAGQRLENLTLQDRSPYLRPTYPARPGTLTFPLGFDGEVRELRLSLRARAADAPQGVLAVLSISEDDGATWRELERFSPHPEHNTDRMWFNHVLHGRPLDARRCRAKIQISGGGLDQVIANSVVKADPRWPAALRVTHAWIEGDQPRQETRMVAPGGGQSAYEVTAGSGVVNQELTIEGVAQ